MDGVQNRSIHLEKLPIMESHWMPEGDGGPSTDYNRREATVWRHDGCSDSEGLQRDGGWWVLEEGSSRVVEMDDDGELGWFYGMH